MPSVSIKPDPVQVDRLRTLLRDLPGKIRTAERDALNKSVGHGKTVAATDLARVMTANKSGVNKRLTLIKATNANLAAALTVRGGLGVNLASFGARQTASGVSAQVNGARTVYARTYLTRGVASSPNPLESDSATGNKIVALNKGAKRAMKMGRYAGRTIIRGPRAGQPILRVPLVAQKGPTVAETWEKTPGIADHTTEEIAAAIPANFTSQANRFLKA